jgi:competence CoiA-like predicted nuclease
LEGKRQLYQWLTEMGESPHLEKYLPAINQRPDLLFTDKEKASALEFQCASLSYSEYKKRTSGYLGIGIEPIWIVGANRLKCLSQGVFQISDFHRQFLSPTIPHVPSILFYCPDAKAFIDLQHLTAFSATISCADLQFIPIKHATLEIMFQTYRDYCPPDSWIKVVRNFRLKPKQRMSKEVNELRLYLYENFQLTLAFLPSEVFLPLSSNYYFVTPAYVWQTYFYFHILSKSFVTATEVAKFASQLLNSRKIKVRKMLASEHTLYTSVLDYLNGLATVGAIKKAGKGRFSIDPNRYLNSLSMEELFAKDRHFLFQLKE